MAKSYKPERNFLVHPSYIVLTLILAGVTALFLGFCGSYLYNRIQQNLNPVSVPVLFYINSVFLIASSFTLLYSKKAYINDDTKKFQQALIATLILTLIFLISQYFAWQEMIANNIKINHSTLASYLFIISGIHFAHVIFGIPFLAYFIYVAHTKMKHPVSVLLYFSDLDKKRKLNLLNIYWHYLDILWIFLVVFFLINLII
jgi:cytochrome c oxidase subunit III